MSNEAITWAYRQNIVDGSKFVLVALADMADEAHSCFPGQAKLAQMTGQSERSVRRQLAQLELAGYITRARRFDKHGHRTSDRYTLPVDADVLAIPTGQNDLSYGLPDKMTSGQNDRRSDTAIPTGHGDRVTQRRTLRTPRPPAETGGAGGQRKRPHCPRHVRHNSKCHECIRLANPPAPKPPWCGACDEQTRLADYDSDKPYRCPDCHPLEVGAAS